MSTVKIILSRAMLVKNLPDPVLEKVQADLKYKNPKYESAKKHGRWISEKTPEFLYYYSRRGSSVFVPKGYMRTLLMYLKNIKYEVIDKTNTTPIDIEFTGKLRNYQSEAEAAITQKRFGFLEASTGSGKTVTGVATACKHKMKTLVVVHNKELQNQWVQAFKKFTNCKDIGTIGGGGKNHIGDVTIGIVNSVINRLDDIEDAGVAYVLLDECHRAVGNTWVDIINGIKYYAHLGLSATPYRRDGLTKALHKIVGPRLFKIDPDMLNEIGAVLRPRVIRIRTDFETDTKDYTRMMTKLTTNHERNTMIADEIEQELKSYAEPIMVVSDRIAHCEAIEDLICWRPNINPVVLTSRLKKDVRKQSVDDMKKGKYNVLISTASLLGEGFDAPNLSAIFLITPMRFSGRLLQVIGRILRPSGSEKPRVYDFRDNWIDKLRWQGFARDRVYEDNNWE